METVIVIQKQRKKIDEEHWSILYTAALLLLKVTKVAQFGKHLVHL